MRAFGAVAAVISGVGLLLSGCGGSSPGPSLGSPSGSSDSPGPAVTSPTAPSPTAGTGAPSGPVPEGFKAAVIQITKADGTTESFCVWLATTPEQRGRGLMSVTSLGGADGMLFRFAVQQSTPFWMKDTVLPLSIGFFDGDGAFVSSADMEPCPPDTACPVYNADAAYTDALEVVQGDLARLGIDETAHLMVTEEACRPDG